MSKTYHTQTARFIAAIADAMPSDVPADVMQGWIESPKALRKALADILCPPHETDFPIWKSVTIGNLGDATAARKQLKAAGIKVGKWGDDILDRATFEDAEATLDLVRVSVKELGLKNGATTAEIYAAAECHGLSRCPDEVAPQLWLQYSDLLSHGESSLVAREEVVDLGRNRSVFYLVHSDYGRGFRAANGHPDNKWDNFHHWVFVRSK